MQWQVFTGKQHGRWASGEPRVTMGCKGMFYLNLAAFRVLGEPVAVEFFLDKMRRIIGVRPTLPTQKNSFLVRKVQDGRYRTIAASAFCQHFGLATSGTLLFNNMEFDDDGVLRLDLVNATKVGRGAR